ncbi:hypothetical protein M9H77_06601 [Catharanthus roseus]|uniref:Uncharacterized protein n=1 Tax=Catharanthus roseus TaxID=4058 RepID=A0ACC0BSM2_CATRO|nr:hypothetical protein M9H77_06601 [Catharanthus roseus]
MLCGSGYFLAGWVRRGPPARVAQGSMAGIDYGMPKFVRRPRFRFRTLSVEPIMFSVERHVGSLSSLTLSLSQSRLSALSVSHSSSISTSFSVILSRQQPQPTTLTSRRRPHPRAESLQTLHEQSTPPAAPLHNTGPLRCSAAAQTPHAAPTHRTSARELSGDNKLDSVSKSYRWFFFFFFSLVLLSLFVLVCPCL